MREQIIRVRRVVDANASESDTMQMQNTAETLGNGQCEVIEVSRAVEAPTQEEIDCEAWGIMQDIVKQHAKTWKELANY